MARHNKHRRTEQYAAKHRKPKDPSGSTATRVGVLASGALAVPIVLGAAGTSSAATMDSWNQVAQRESGGNWSINYSGDGMSVGGVQFQNQSWQTSLAFLNSKGVNTSTWTQSLFQGMPTTSVPSKNQQIAAAEALLHLQPNPWAASGASPGTSMFDGGPNPWGLPGAQLPAELGGMPVKKTPPPVSSSKAAIAVAYAKAHISSAPYLWGGEGPTRFDCSGLTMMAWKAAGVDIPRTSQQQLAGLPRVAQSDIKPGDLVIWTFSNTPFAGHVSMYVGPIGPNGEDLIDTASSHPGGGVNWSTMAGRGGHVEGVVRPAPYVAPAPKPKPVQKPVKPSPVAAQVLNLVNAERAKVGAPKLVGTQELNAYAQKWSETQAASGKMYHSKMTFSGNPVGENVAYGYDTAREVMHGWMTSPGHKANILDPKFTKLGVGAAKSKSGQIYWTQEFAGGPVPAPTPVPPKPKPVPKPVTGDTYTVKSGDTLWDIAKVQLGDPLKWREIYNASHLKSGDPALIFPGETVNLPK